MAKKMVWGNLKADVKALINLRRKALAAAKKALKAPVKDVQNRVKGNAPVDTGALKYSIGAKFFGKGQVCGAVIGPRKSYTKVTKDGVEQKPFKYAHLVEKKTGFLSMSMSAADLETLKNGVGQEIKKLLK